MMQVAGLAIAFSSNSLKLENGPRIDLIAHIFIAYRKRERHLKMYGLTQRLELRSPSKLQAWPGLCRGFLRHPIVRAMWSIQMNYLGNDHKTKRTKVQIKADA